MFTGLVEEKGSVAQLIEFGSGEQKVVKLVIRASAIMPGVKIGDSIAINGCCLTVVEIGDDNLTFQAGMETLSRTNLGDLRIDSSVNLERALAVGDRLGGHYVTGHVDALGKVDERIDHQSDDGEWSDFWFRVPSALTAQMASKGSVAIDGISLTLIEVNPDRFSVQIIPHTLAETTLGDRNVGDAVNIETDLFAKYVEQQLSRQSS